MVLFNKWITSLPLSSGDWSAIPSSQLHEWFPWPSIWAPENTFGFKNFEQIYEFPIFALAGALSQLSLPWGVIEKLLYFWPFAVLSLVAPWMLGRELLGDRRWALLSAFLYCSNTYLLLVSTVGNLFLAVAEVIAPLVLLAFIRTMRRMSMRWGLVTGLLLALEGAYELRIAYLTVLMLAIYLVVTALSEPRLITRRVALSVVVGAVFAGTEAYWLLPYLSYQGDHGLPVALSPWIAFMNLSHGFTGVDPYWTWSAPTWFRTVPVFPAFFLVPVIAFLVLLRRRSSPELLWLACSVLLAAFLIKQTNPPFGTVYGWMFSHFPGWSLFREASKLYFVVAIGYAILVPFSLRSLWRARPLRIVSATAGVGIAVLVVASLQPLFSGTIGSTTNSIEEPQAFAAFESTVARDPQYGALLWLGGPWVQGAPFKPDLTLPGGEPLFHRFSPLSPRHPVVEAWGGKAQDPLSPYCRVSDTPFCYVDPSLLPYLTTKLAISYVIAPAGESVGRLPQGYSFRTLFERLSPILGKPLLLGDGANKIAVWKLPAQPMVVEAPAVAMVAGSTAATQDVLPVLSMLGLPVAYEFDGSSGRPSSAGPVVGIIPRGVKSYRIRTAQPFLISALSNRPSILVTESGSRLTLPLVRHSGDQGLYGPLFLESGDRVIDSVDGTTLGPLISWSKVTSAVFLGDGSRGFPAVVERLHDEQVQVPSATGANRWIELRNSFDEGWLVSGAPVHLRGEAIFNLYLVPAGVPLTSQFSTTQAERFGLIFTFIWLCLAALGIAFLPSSLRLATPRESMYPLPVPTAPVARMLALAGFAVLGLAVLDYIANWLGLPSVFPALVAWFGYGSRQDPYAVADWYIAFAMLLFGVSIVVSIMACRGSERALE
jgi:hypothetical protein